MSTDLHPHLECRGCRRSLPLFTFPRPALARPGVMDTCKSCASGRDRVAALARNGRPHLFYLTPEVRECFLAWETGRLAFSRALKPFGLEVIWRGFEPIVRVRPGSRAAAQAVEPSLSAKPH